MPQPARPPDRLREAVDVLPLHLLQLVPPLLVVVAGQRLACLGLRERELLRAGRLGVGPKDTIE